MMEKYNFTVGSRPQWTPELIKQLPYGTVLRCAFFIEDIFAYNGQKIECDSAQDIFVDSFYFTFKKRNRYAEIVILPDIKEETPVIEEPKAGDMVEATDNSFMSNLLRCRFTGGYHSDGRPIIESVGQIYPMKYIRLPHKSEVESKANELKTLIMNSFLEDDKRMKIIIEAIKWGQANPDKI